MNNNQNVNDASSFGVLNNNNAPQPAVPNVAAPQAPVAQAPTNVNVVNNVPNTNQNNVVTLGEVSNVTYADTIGNIDYGAPAENAVDVPVENKQENFINNDYNETSISDMNVEGTYNNMNVAPDYSTDPKVKELLHPEEKTTIKIGKDLKFFILVVVGLLAFIFVMPYAVDIVKKIIYH